MQKQLAAKREASWPSPTRRSLAIGSTTSCSNTAYSQLPCWSHSTSSTAWP